MKLLNPPEPSSWTLLQDGEHVYTWNLKKKKN